MSTRKNTPAEPDLTPAVQFYISRATELLEAKSTIQEGLADCRNMLHSFAKQGKLNEEQLKWLGEHLPKQTRTRRKKTDAADAPSE